MNWNSSTSKLELEILKTPQIQDIYLELFGVKISELKHAIFSMKFQNIHSSLLMNNNKFYSDNLSIEILGMNIYRIFLYEIMCSDFFIISSK